MPPWTTVEADHDIVCRLNQRLGDVYPVDNIDVVVVGIFHQVLWLQLSDNAFWGDKKQKALPGRHCGNRGAGIIEDSDSGCGWAAQVAELLVGVPAPVLYWEQGHEWLFGDPVRFQVSFVHSEQCSQVQGPNAWTRLVVQFIGVMPGRPVVQALSRCWSCFTQLCGIVD